MVIFHSYVKLPEGKWDLEKKDYLSKNDNHWTIIMMASSSSKIIVTSHFSLANATWTAEFQPNILEIANKQHTPVEICLESMANPSIVWTGVGSKEFPWEIWRFFFSHSVHPKQCLPIQSQLWVPWHTMTIDFYWFLAQTSHASSSTSSEKFLPKHD